MYVSIFFLLIFKCVSVWFFYVTEKWFFDEIRKNSWRTNKISVSKFPLMRDPSPYCAALKWALAMKMFQWSRTWTLCALNVVNNIGQERTTCTITRMMWTMTWSAIFAFNPCCSHWTPPVVIHSAISAYGTFCRRRISALWIAKGFTLSCAKNPVSLFTNCLTSS